MAEMSGHDGWYLVLATSMMVACNTGMTKTPLGSALVVSEMTAVSLVPPLVIAALVSLFLTSGVAFVGGQRHREQPSPPLRTEQPLTPHPAPEPAGRPPAHASRPATPIPPARSNMTRGPAATAAAPVIPAPGAFSGPNAAAHNIASKAGAGISRKSRLARRIHFRAPFRISAASAFFS